MHAYKFEHLNTCIWYWFLMHINQRSSIINACTVHLFIHIININVIGDSDKYIILNIKQFFQQNKHILKLSSESCKNSLYFIEQIFKII